MSRRQILDLGGDDDLIERMIRRREWVRVHRGVYANHTGPLSWQQRAWAAVLLLTPAALTGVSALRAHGVRGHDRDEWIESSSLRDPRVARHASTLRTWLHLS